MFNVSKILFFAFFTTLCVSNESTVLKGMYNKLQEDIFEPKECYTKLMGYYLENEGPSKSFTAGDNVHDLCPNIHQSCCSFEQLVEIHGQAKKSFEKSIKFAEILVDLVNNVANMTSQTKDAVVERVTNSNCFWEDDKGHSFLTALEHLKNNRDEINDSIRRGIEYYSIKNANFACTLCDQSSHEAIITKRRQTPIIQIDTKQCKMFFGNPETHHVVNTIINIRQIYTVYGGLACSKDLKHFKGDVSEIAFPEQLSEVSGYYQSCGNSNEMMKNKSCQAICEEMVFFNANYFAKYMEDLFAFKLMGEMWINNIEYEKEGLEIPFDKMVEEVGYYYWVQPRGKSGIEKLPKQYSYGTGWNIMTHSFVTQDAFLEIDEHGQKSIILRGGLPKMGVLILALTTWLFIKLY